MTLSICKLRSNLLVNRASLMSLESQSFNPTGPRLSKTDAAHTIYIVQCTLYDTYYRYIDKGKYIGVT